MRRIITFALLLTFVTYSAHCATRSVATRGATQSATAAPAQKVAARAAATQKVIGSGTKVATAAQNTTSGEECVQKFAGCMDSFCLTENIDGGRCQCSAEHAKLSAELSEISATDRNSYKIATAGVEIAESGDIPTRGRGTKQTSRVDLSLWSAPTAPDNSDDENDISKLTGTALLRQATEICLEKLPECKSAEQFIRARYTAQIKSDCVAFENAVKQQRSTSQAKQAEAQRAVRSATYQRMQATNKYDLGQCVIEYKKCMTTTAGCGDDFKGCIGTSVSGKNQKSYDITNSNTKITIEASTYDILDSKKPICDSVLNSCSNVRNQVWDAFLRAVGPELKTAELLAESDMRTSCMDKISSCFVKACKDSIDPNDPDGSYDMCLSRPETVRSLCKNEIDPCVASEPLILDYVYARLSAMRVDSCTAEVKECLQSDDRCGKDYTQCVGLDTDTIIRMCPYDKLVGCQQVYGETDIRGAAVYDALATMVQGIMLNIDNNILEFCENAAYESMIKVCGSTENCNNIITNNLIGAKPLEYAICEYAISNNIPTINYNKCYSRADQISDEQLGRVKGSTTGELGPVTPLTALIDGMMFYEFINPKDNGLLTDANEYFSSANTTEIRDEKREEITQEITELQTLISSAITAIESDPTVQYCMTGRKIQGMKNFPEQEARFPKLTNNIRHMITTAAITEARKNYYQKYDQISTQLLQDYVKIGERQAEIRGENAKDIRRELGRQACVSLADMAALPMSPPPPSGWGMTMVSIVAITAAAVVTVFTAGAGGIAAGAMLGSFKSSMAAGASLWQALGSSITAYSASLATSSAIAIGAGVVGGASLAGGIIAQGSANTAGNSQETLNLEMNGHHNLDQWNYKQIIDTEYDWDSLSCHKCVKSTICLKTSSPIFGKPSCKKWAEETEECSDTQF